MLDLDLRKVFPNQDDISTEVEENLYEANASMHANENKIEHRSDIKSMPIATQSQRKHLKINDLADHDIVKLATNYIENHLSSKITLPHLVKVTGYSERAIQLVFQRHFQQTPFGYIESQRLLKAKALIETYKLSKKISNIALDVGLPHLGRFSLKFKKRFGMSPSSLAKD